MGDVDPGQRTDVRRILPQISRRRLTAEKTRVFVYGSLRRGQKHHGLIKNAHWLGENKTEPLYELMDLGPYPALVKDGQTGVSGEVYEVDAITLRTLDQLEGHPDRYRRQMITLADGSTCDTYILPIARTSHAQRVTSGDWTKR